jgi:hypothetical protein
MEPRSFCDCCKHMALPDARWPHICRICAGKLRQIDSMASNRNQIHDEMRKTGVPMKGGDFRG